MTQLESNTKKVRKLEEYIEKVYKLKKYVKKETGQIVLKIKIWKKCIKSKQDMLKRQIN